MPHYCRVCGTYRANERFTGRGHRIHICKDCQKLPRQHRQSADAESEIHGFFHQSHISRKNLTRLRFYCSSQDPRIAALAEAALAAALVAPYKRRRYRLLAEKHPQIFTQLSEADLLPVIEPRDYERAIDHLAPEHDLASVAPDDSDDTATRPVLGADGQDEIPF